MTCYDPQPQITGSPFGLAHAAVAPLPAIIHADPIESQPQMCAALQERSMCVTSTMRRRTHRETDTPTHTHTPRTKTGRASLGHIHPHPIQTHLTHQTERQRAATSGPAPTVRTVWLGQAGGLSIHRAGLVEDRIHLGDHVFLSQDPRGPRRASASAAQADQMGSELGKG